MCEEIYDDSLEGEDDLIDDYYLLYDEECHEDNDFIFDVITGKRKNICTVLNKKKVTTKELDELFV